MIELHPEILTKNGKPQFAVLPYEEYVRLRDALERLNGGALQPDARYGGFFDNLTAQELAHRQGIEPVTRAEDLYGPGDPADWEGFDEAVARWRAEHPTS